MARPVSLGSALADLARTLPGAELPAPLRRRLVRDLDAARAYILADLDARGVLACAAALGVHRDTLHAWRAPGGWLHDAHSATTLARVSRSTRERADVLCDHCGATAPRSRMVADPDVESESGWICAEGHGCAAPRTERVTVAGRCAGVAREVGSVRSAWGAVGSATRGNRGALRLPPPAARPPPVSSPARCSPSRANGCEGDRRRPARDGVVAEAVQRAGDAVAVVRGRGLVQHGGAEARELGEAGHRALAPASHARMSGCTSTRGPRSEHRAHAVTASARAAARPRPAPPLRSSTGSVSADHHRRRSPATSRSTRVTRGPSRRG
jgi:hypothetical protein